MSVFDMDSTYQLPLRYWIWQVKYMLATLLDLGLEFK